MQPAAQTRRRPVADAPAGPDLDAARCYRAILARDRRFDGRFFTAVVTTGIYCRPVCPAPTPHRRNVRFYACAAAAEAAGFRPCKRCRPETAPGTPAWSGTSAIVARALRLLALPDCDGTVEGTAPARRPASRRAGTRAPSTRSAGTLADGVRADTDRPDAALAARLGVTDRHLRRLFLAHLGATPGAIARANRVHLARRLLDDTRLPITDVAFAAGFESIRQFNHAMRATFGAPPRALRAASDRTPASEGAIRSPLLLRLAYRPPFDWPALRDFLALRATPGVEVADDSRYRRSVLLAGAPAILSLHPELDRCHFVLGLEVLGSATALPLPAIAPLVARARRILDLDADPARIAAALRRSAVLAASVRAHPGLRVPGAWDPFELAVRAVLGQQVTVRGATELAGRTVARFGTPIAGTAAAPGTGAPSAPGERRSAGEAQPTHLFPTPAQLRDADLAAIGMPGARAAAIRGLAAAVADRALVLDDGAPLEEIVARLAALPGIGEWTAQYVAMRALGEPDAFPASDLGLRRALAAGDGLLPARRLAVIAEAWRPWRAYAAMHLWRMP